jgi:adhesin transport system outer membrane protein
MSLRRAFASRLIVVAGLATCGCVHAWVGIAHGAETKPQTVVDLRAELLSQTEAEVIASFGVDRLKAQRELSASEPPTEFLRLMSTAVRRHPSIRVVLAQRTDADEAVRGARAAQYPQVSLGFNTSAQISNRDFDNTLTPRRSTNYIDGGVEVNQRLFDAGATFRRIDAAKDRSRASLHQAQATVESFALDSISAYLDIVRTRAQLTLARENVSRHESVLNYVLERVRAGAGSRADQLRVESRLSDARSVAIGLNAAEEEAVARYRELFKEEPEDPILPGFHPPMPVDDDAAVAAARAANPTFLRGQALTEAARNEYKAALNDQWPSVSLRVYGTHYDVLKGRTQSQLFDVTGQVRVAYNLFTGGAETARRRQVQSRLHEAMYTEETFALELDRAVRNAMTEIETRTERLRALELAAGAGAATIDAYSEQFTVGRRSLTELLDAQRDHGRSLLELIDSRIELEIARYRLLALAGGLATLINVSDMAKTNATGPSP